MSDCAHDRYDPAIHSYCPDCGMACSVVEIELLRDEYRRLREENERMRPVYDAAMDWYELHDQPGTAKECEAWIKFRYACRQAKREVKE